MSVNADEWPELSQGEEILTDSNELLWRQVHPQRINGGVISSEAFEPGRSDAKQLSCSRESKVSAREAFEHYTLTLEGKSAGVAAVSVEDVGSGAPIPGNESEVASLRAVDDTASGVVDLPPGHAYIDFRPLGSARATKKAKQLAFLAHQRGGIQFPAS
mgnify:CR=1 FL=1